MSHPSRTGVILVSHGDAARAMLESAVPIVGPIETLVVTVPPGETREVTARRIEEACQALKTEEVLFLVDLEGSTPFNVCSKRAETSAILSGVNLPMLFKLATVDRDRPALDLAEELRQTGLKSIHIRAGGAGQGEP